ncbi:WD40/YVTN/BNR-like repeat-containing protein [Phenylobacterium montanum]|uniref:Glycosyl hydrolase n=1 Tax=Phenylobacterium montanum TaxID=2823693 RepID=A0A975IWV3_9CAUL|nr:hypothetical protein [Caulobacter sp. S6]QUD90288.1 hypothetical protein KCG34_10690 [Caulobacter sp. S6]
MEPQRTLLVSTDGQAVIRSHNDGETWHRLTINQDLEYDDCVRCLLADPQNPEAVFAGAERGLFKSEDCGVTWNRIDSVLNDVAIWKLVAGPSDPKIMYAGTGSPSRAAFYRSADAGRTWEQTTLLMPPKCAGVSRPRMLAMAVDPEDPRDVWVGVEEGGLFRTRDGGDEWERIDGRFPPARGNSDIHSVVVLPGAQKRIVVVSVTSIFISTDDGQTWRRRDVKDSWGIYYSRVLVQKPGAQGELFLGIGDGTPGSTALFLRSRDGGETWENAPFPVQPNSCLWAIGVNQADPNLVLAGTKFGDLYRSLDGGLSWRKEWREFSEITDLTWLPGSPASGGANPDVHA